MKARILLLSLPFLLAAGLAHADPPYGVEDYVRYCSACHGETADGNGPVANVLKPRPPALTRLHSKYGSPLGTELVVYVLGDKMPRAHGVSDMPVWGRNLREPQGSDKREATGTIWRIVNYLDAIQPKPDE